VSSFGFGGTNFHFVLEEYAREHQAGYRLQKSAEYNLLSAATPEA
jgi:acyl transferase domain-containing protein